MPREGTQLVCDGFVAALRVHGVPQEVLTDNGKVFTGKYSRPPVDVLFGVPQQVLTDMASSFTGKYAKPPVDVLFAATFTHRPARARRTLHVNRCWRSRPKWTLASTLN